MYICFEYERIYPIEKYPIKGIQIETDENGIPGDINIITDDKETLLTIADKHGHIGFNYQEYPTPEYCAVDINDPSKGVERVNEPTGWQGLYARLDKFRIEW